VVVYEKTMYGCEWVKKRTGSFSFPSWVIDRRERQFLAFMRGPCRVIYFLPSFLAMAVSYDTRAATAAADATKKTRGDDVASLSHSDRPRS
jgi:hypothetical protein